jgi:aminoglycoside N3'-acetyltransferase
MLDVVRCIVDEQDKIVVVFSALWTFGHRFGRGREAASLMLKTLREAVGDDRTLVLPAYYFNFPKTRLFDVRRTMPQTGALPVVAMTDPTFVRSAHPMDSYLASGPQAHEIVACRQSTSWGDDSVMGMLELNRARIVVLGVSWGQGCGYLHRAEEKICVPYRYYKTFSGELLVDGRDATRCSETVFVRPLGVSMSNRYDAIDTHIPQLASFRNSGDD